VTYEPLKVADALRDSLARLRVAEPPRVDTELELVRAIRRQQRRRLLRSTATVLGAVLLGAGLSQLWDDVATTAPAMPAQRELQGPANAPRTRRAPLFALFLLEENRGVPQPDPTLMEQEYRDWAAALVARGQMAFAREMHGAPVTVTTNAVRDADATQVLSGMFLVYARDSSEAVALARSLPHARDGGRVLMQRIDPRE